MHSMRCCPSRKRRNSHERAGKYPSIMPEEIWRAMAKRAVFIAFGALDQGGIRLALLRPLGRAATPDEAAELVMTAADELKLDEKQRLEVTAIVANLRKRGSWEAEL
jgi:hypothetical protein